MGKVLAQGAITLISARKIPDLLPKSYSHNRCCEYHSGMVGHSTDDYFSLKHKIWDLINDEKIAVKQVEQQANVAHNPLLQHEVGVSISTVIIEHDEDTMVIT